ncbi:MAG: hypothetical protein ACE5ID_03135, partial [Acidobacteriota bacterium]
HVVGSGMGGSEVGESRAVKAARTVLLINGSLTEDSVLVRAVNGAGASCLQLDEAAALSFLRTNPFRVAAVILVGHGSSAPSGKLLEGIKQAAPRLPIVFVDSSSSMASELRIRRAGVHFYSHIPVNGEELEAVLALLAGVVPGPEPSRPPGLVPARSRQTLAQKGGV